MAAPGPNPRPQQAMPSIPSLSDAETMVLQALRNRHTWDTIILCTLADDLFGRPIYSKEIANVISVRDGRTNVPFHTAIVVFMFGVAQRPFIEELYPLTCRYKKWEGVDNKLRERNGQRDYDDMEEMSAWILYNETLTTANLIASNQLGSSSARQQGEGEHLSAEGDKA
ncbi:hypothetical protein HO173_011874 [Letharia columbiana]|uniref:Uncharacterized protein n=1 Tax=Letharia columbiana TaxID=112416 RepID=A0A8H6CSW2_9LECA|nr:uncharacterized protein HO173_011874 [Letharia columbiana]KAF6228571.1 hypothetical protein HO173_011874 [Letharia columbiana]